MEQFIEKVPILFVRMFVLDSIYIPAILVTKYLSKCFISLMKKEMHSTHASRACSKVCLFTRKNSENTQKLLTSSQYIVTLETKHDFVNLSYLLVTNYDTVNTSNYSLLYWYLI